ncbi:S-adenosyl-L-methionine-dependent methyltransferase [Mycena olivaceomarginata]|nr:S-adenosyl-L-methionine-dependent methyltransferase [Mycena olivaceomarginata]
MAPAVTATAVAADAPDTYEEKHVHQIYDSIASHFSSTRYKPWPIIAAFLANLRDGWVGLDSGTGNGKYLPLPADRPGRVWTIGLDRSRNLLDIARTGGRDRRDYAISIATIHHLATHERRKLAVKRLLSAVSPAHGRVLVYVWAVRQDELSKRSIPWRLKWDGAGRVRAVFNRYYHMFDDGELAGLVTLAAEELGLVVGRPSTGSLRGVEIVQDGWERSNHYVELRRWQTQL